MPFVDDMMQALQIQIDAFWYNILLLAAGLHWGALRAVLLAGYTIELVNRWLAENAFAPLVGQTAASLQTAFNVAFVVAMLVLGITYLLAAFARLNVVEPRSAILWYLAGALFFSAGPGLYTGMNTMRATIANALYTSTLTGLQSSSGTAFGSLSSVTADGIGILTPCDNFGSYLGAPGGVDGLDVALAYLRADGVDVMGYGSTCTTHYPSSSGGVVGLIPTEWEQPGSFFDSNLQGVLYATLTDDERAESIRLASASHGRLLTAWPLVLFGLAEQGVYLLLTVAQGLTFMSFGVAVLFAFFKRTEVIARSVIDQWIELIVQTVVISIVQALVVAFFLAGAATGSGVVVLGVGIVCSLFIGIVLWSGIRAVWNSLNRLFSAMSQASGSVIVTPGTAGMTSATAGLATAGAAVGAGASALAGMAAMQSGATAAQAAGVSAGGSQVLSGAARTLAYLPGLRGTSLGEAAEQFTEGSITRQVASRVPVVGRAAGPLVGAALLTDRSPDTAEYDETGRVAARPMLVPAVGAGLDGWTIPRAARDDNAPARRRRATPDSDYIEDENGDMLPLSRMPRRTGTFTPDTSPAADDRRRQRSDAAREMGDEEAEQHLSDVMRTSTGINSPLSTLLERQSDNNSDDLRNAADQLANSANRLTTGQLQVSGVSDVSSVVADVVGVEQRERQRSGQPTDTGIDHMQVGNRLAQAVGVTPDVSTPVQRDLARFGLFVDRALRAGLSPEQTETVVREVQTSPDGRLSDTTRTGLDQQVQRTGNTSWSQARDTVDRLEHSARMLPTTLTVRGALEVPPVQVEIQTPAAPDSTPSASSALSGSEIHNTGGERP